MQYTLRETLPRCKSVTVKLAKEHSARQFSLIRSSPALELGVLKLTAIYNKMHQGTGPLGSIQSASDGHHHFFI